MFVVVSAKWEAGETHLSSEAGTQTNLSIYNVILAFFLVQACDPRSDRATTRGEVSDPMEVLTSITHEKFSIIH